LKLTHQLPDELTLRLVSHGQKAVDPLKLGRSGQFGTPSTRLPRSEGRGPIEALRASGGVT